MAAFIASAGTLFELGCPSALSRETAQEPRFFRTMDGKRKAYIRKGGRRSWSVDVSVARPGEVSTLESVARHLGPVGWYPPEAVRGNLLSPQASGFDVVPNNSSGEGLVQLPDGSVASSIRRTGSALIYVGGPSVGTGIETVPVKPGATVSVGAWATESCRMAVLWRNAAGENLSSSTGATTSGTTDFTYRTDTFTAPPGAVLAGLYFSTSTRMARPSISWGSTVRDEMGTGCPSAIIHDPSHSPIALWDGANYTNSSYQVTEVG